MTDKKKRSDAQRAADKAYEAKRSNRPRLPSVYLTDAENQLLCELADKYGSKKASIIRGLEQLKKSTGKL